MGAGSQSVSDADLVQAIEPGSEEFRALLAERVDRAEARDGRSTLIRSVASGSHDPESLERLAGQLRDVGDRFGAACTLVVLSDLYVMASRLHDSAVAAADALTTWPDAAPWRNRLLSRTAITHQRLGELRAALRLARTAYAEAVASDDDDGSLWSGSCLAAFATQLGELSQADRYTRFVDLTGEPSDEVSMGQYQAVATMLRGVVHALRGRWVDAANDFDAAERISDATCPWFRWLVDTYRGVHLGVIEPPMPDERLAELRRMTPLDGGELEWRFHHAQGVALIACGQVALGIDRLRRALGAVDQRWDRALIELQLGEALVEHEPAGVEAGEALLRHAVSEFADMGTVYWQALAHAAMARSVPGQAALHWAIVHSIDDGDPAYQCLYDRQAELRVHVGPSAEVTLGGERVGFAGRQAEFVVYALVLLGDGGLTFDEIVALLWESGEPDRVRQRLRTLQWQVRRGLRHQAWRLRRDGDRLHFDGRGVDVTGQCPTSSVGEAPSCTLLDGWEHLGPEPVAWLRTRACTEHRANPARGRADLGPPGSLSPDALA